MHLSIARIRGMDGRGCFTQHLLHCGVSTYKYGSFEQIKVETGSLIIEHHVNIMS